MYVYITASFNMIWIRNWIWISICISRSLFAAAVAPLSHPLQLLADSFAPSSHSLYSFLCKCYICCFFSRFYVYNIYIIYSFFLPFSYFFSFRFLFLTLFLMLLFSASSSCYISSVFSSTSSFYGSFTVVSSTLMTCCSCSCSTWKSVCMCVGVEVCYLFCFLFLYFVFLLPHWFSYSCVSLIWFCLIRFFHWANFLEPAPVPPYCIFSVILTPSVFVCFLFFFFLFPHWFSYSCLILIRLEPAPVPPSCICSLRVCVCVRVSLSLSHGPSGSLFVHLFLSLFLLLLSSPWADPRGEA